MKTCVDQVTPEAKRRLEQLQHFQKLRREGLRNEQACERAGVSRPTLWRWQVRWESGGLAALSPRKSPGRPSVLKQFKVTKKSIRQVQHLILQGVGNARAWQLFAESADCSAPLSARLKKYKTLPPSLLRATRLQKLPATVVLGPSLRAVQLRESGTIKLFRLRRTAG